MVDNNGPCLDGPCARNLLDRNCFTLQMVASELTVKNVNRAMVHGSDGLDLLIWIINSIISYTICCAS
jgi:hypothetical protein